VSDWPAFIIVPVFLAHFLATRPYRQWPWIFAFCCTACALFATLYIYIALATNSPWNWMVPLITKHSAIGGKAPFTLSQWFATAMVDNRARHTLPLLVGSGLWLITLGPRIRLSQPGATVARILIAWGILHVSIGRVGVYTDEVWWSPLTPGLAVSAALLVDSILRAADGRQFSHVANSVAALLIVLFASWTGLTTFKELYPRKLDDPFTTVELGQAVRAAAPNPNDLALLVGGDPSPQWWFYGDRPLRINVWTVEDLERRLRADSADITYGYWQSWNAAGAGIVFPSTWHHDFGHFRAYLQQHYPTVPLPTPLAAKFEVFDLRHPLAGAP
jgi:hypothetical protein